MKHGKALAVAGSVSLVAAIVAAAPTAFAQEQPGPTQAQGSATLTQVATATAPTTGAAGPNGSLWIVERAGRVRVLDGQGLGTPILDLSNEVSTAGEGGMVGIAFSQGFERVYLSFTNLNGNNQLVEMAVANGQPQVGTRRTVLEVDQPGPAHNSGDITFGPDGMLYMSFGDGDFSNEGDPHDNGQNLGTLLGSVIRIDLNAGSPYGIPPDNPFVNTPGARGEVWAYGLRNPWRISFDAATGDFWLGDVGQFSREEVNYRSASAGGGANFGWPIMEGTLQNRPGQPVPPDHVPPMLEYNTVSGQRCSVTGGNVYRGNAIPPLQGMFVFSDWCEGAIRALQVQNGQLIQEINLGINAGRTVAFFEDHNLELYALDIAGGGVYRLDPTTPPTTTTPPVTTTPPTTTPPVSESPTVPIGGCLVQYTADHWGGSSGFTAAVSVTNTSGAAISGWSLAWQYSAGQVVNEHWNASISQVGSSVTATNAGWNGTIAPQQTVSFGFNGAAATAGNNPAPTTFTLNGVNCAVG